MMRRTNMPEDILPFTPDMGSLSKVALTSEHFKKRIQQGFNRVKRLGAESGFIILSDGTEIVYPPLVLGGKDADPEIGTFYGSSAETGTIGVSSAFFNARYATFDQYQIIGDFHFHPDYAPFSEIDMDGYDDLLINGIEQFGANIRLQPSGLYGVFMPRRSKAAFERLDLLMFQGPATSNDYQGYDFTELTLSEQRALLESSGMKVDLRQMPVIKNRVQFED